VCTLDESRQVTHNQGGIKDELASFFAKAGSPGD
jgi:hypothetical protein